jgi:hypothetical protein
MGEFGGRRTSARAAGLGLAAAKVQVEGTVLELF